MKIIKLALTALVLSQTLSFAAVVTVDMGSGSYNLRNNGGTSLTAGVAATNGDGALIFLGYYSDGTAANPFGVSSDSNFVKLSGIGNTFGTSNTTIGDFAVNAPADGEFFINGLLINDTVNPGGLPSAGTSLVVRVLDAATEGGATYMMEFANPTNPNWAWKSPAVPAPGINIDFDSPLGTILMRDAANRLGSAATSISGGGPLNANINVTAVPEPSTFGFGILVAVSAFASRFRRRK